MTETINLADTVTKSDKPKLNSFSSLGVWRRLYLVLMWIIMSCIPLYLIYFTLFELQDIQVMLPTTLIFSVLCFAYAYWIHTAVVKRKVRQLRILCFISIIPCMNPITALIFWVIGSASKREINSLDKD